MSDLPNMPIEKYCQKCGNILWIDDGKVERYNIISGEPIYSAKVECSNYAPFSGHYSKIIHGLSREAYNYMVGELLKKP